MVVKVFLQMPSISPSCLLSNWFTVLADASMEQGHVFAKQGVPGAAQLGLIPGGGNVPLARGKLSQLKPFEVRSLTAPEADQGPLQLLFPFKTHTLLPTPQ